MVLKSPLHTKGNYGLRNGLSSKLGTQVFNVIALFPPILPSGKKARL
jgi:hypothetical protein